MKFRLAYLSILRTVSLSEKTRNHIVFTVENACMPRTSSFKSRDRTKHLISSPTRLHLAVMADAASSDVELLLEQEERPLRSSWFPRRVALALGCVGLVAVAVVARGGSRGLRSKARAITVLDDDCYETATYYGSPVKMAGSERTIEFSIEACQQRCFNIPDCAHFSYWPDGGCLVTDDSSTALAAPEKFAETVSGPPYCGEKPKPIADPIAAGIAAAADTVQTAAEQASVEVPTVGPVAAIPGINGTTCAKYPACVAAGIAEGNCCPNDDQVALGCCSGFAPVVAAVKIAAGTECSSFPQCAALNISGACCPTADGTRLGCCGSI